MKEKTEEERNKGGGLYETERHLDEHEKQDGEQEYKSSERATAKSHDEHEDDHSNAKDKAHHPTLHPIAKELVVSIDVLEIESRPRIADYGTDIFVRCATKPSACDGLVGYEIEGGVPNYATGDITTKSTKSRRVGDENDNGDKENRGKQGIDNLAARPEEIEYRKGERKQ